MMGHHDPVNVRIEHTTLLLPPITRKVLLRIPIPFPMVRTDPLDGCCCCDDDDDDDDDSERVRTSNISKRVAKTIECWWRMMMIQRRRRVVLVLLVTPPPVVVPHRNEHTLEPLPCA
jgi:hypothetical protein